MSCKSLISLLSLIELGTCKLSLNFRHRFVDHFVDIMRSVRRPRPGGRGPGGWDRAPPGKGRVGGGVYVVSRQLARACVSVFAVTAITRDHIVPASVTMS